jgi:hypothetical protein
VRSKGSAVAFAVLWCCSFAPTAAAGQPCQGDCNGDGQVSISELVLAVTIALGQTSIDACAVLGPGPVDIAKLITSINSALCACRQCPTRPPTRTPTATPRPTATPQAQTFESVWREDDARLGASTCRADINQSIRDAFPNVNCPLTVVRQGDRVAVTDCDGFFYEGTIDGGENFRAPFELSESVGPCSVFVDFDLTVNLGRSPSTANYAVAVDFSGNCGDVRDCSLGATTRWTRLSGTVGTAAAAGAPRGLVGRLLPSVLSP